MWNSTHVVFFSLLDLLPVVHTSKNRGTEGKRNGRGRSLSKVKINESISFGISERGETARVCRGRESHPTAPKPYFTFLCIHPLTVLCLPPPLIHTPSSFSLLLNPFPLLTSGSCCNSHLTHFRIPTTFISTFPPSQLMAPFQSSSSPCSCSVISCLFFFSSCQLSQFQFLPPPHTHTEQHAICSHQPPFFVWQKCLPKSLFPCSVSTFATTTATFAGRLPKNYFKKIHGGSLLVCRQLFHSSDLP